MFGHEPRFRRPQIWGIGLDFCNVLVRGDRVERDRFTKTGRGHGSSKLLFGLALLSMMLGTSGADAQSATLNQFRPAPIAQDGFAISTAEDQGHARFGAQLYLDWADDPHPALPAGRPDVSSQLTGTLLINVGLWDRLVLWAGLPVNFIMDGPVGDGFGLGDVSIGARVRIFGEADDIFQLGLQGRIFTPTADAASGGQTLSGEQGIAGMPELLFQFNPGPARIAFNVGALIREDQGRPNDMLTLGMGVHLDAIEDTLQILIEGFSNTDFENIFQSNWTDIELLGGLKYAHESGVSVGVGAGPGFLDGFGAPDYRVLGMVAFTEPGKKKGPKDKDGDLILDADDKCPDEPEDIDGFEDEDGCPDPDNDGDGVNDDADKCPNEAGPKENKGCPWPDQDGDGVPDRVDNCPKQAGPVENQGCRKKQKVIIRETHIEILDKVFFRTGSSRLQSRSYPLLRNIAEVLIAHPEIEKVLVEGHTDSTGRFESNMRLSRRRAQSVVDYIVRRGVAIDRLESEGFGPTKPLVPDARTRDELAQNRRVEFKITQQAKPVEEVKEE